MTKQISTLVSTQWLLPLFNEQLNDLHQLWNDAYYKSSADDFSHISSVYHDFVARLDVANLQVFRYLGQSIHTFLEALADGTMPIKQALIALYASELLQYELNSYAKTGKYQVGLLLKRSDYLIQLLNQAQVDIADLKAVDAPNVDDYSNVNKEDYDALFLLDGIGIPTPDNVERLSASKLQSLHSVWRHSAQHLLQIKENHPPTLDKLEKIAQYLQSDATAHELKMDQALWYLAALWFDALALNDEPKPSVYAHILSDLDSMIMSMQAQHNPSKFAKALLIDIYIQLSGLNITPSATTFIIQNIQDNLNSDKRFLPRMLEQLEKLIFMLDTPLKVIKPLQAMKTQLAGRGWYMYEQQIEQVLQELYAIEESPDSYSTTRWQIERQLQELYGAILSSDETINTDIGQLSTQPNVDVNYGFTKINDSAGNDTVSLQDATADMDDGFIQIDMLSDALLEPTNDFFSQNNSVDTKSGVDTNNVDNLDTVKINDKPNNTDADANISDKSITTISDDLDIKALRKVRIAVEDIKTSFGSFLYTHSLAELPQSDLFDTLHQAFTEIQLYDVVEVIDQCASVFAEIHEYELTHLTWRLKDTIADGLAVLEFFLDFLAHQTLDLKLLNDALERFESARTQLVELAQSPKLAEEALPTPSASYDDAIRYDDSGEVTVQKTTKSESDNSPTVADTHIVNTQTLTDKNNDLNNINDDFDFNEDFSFSDDLSFDDNTDASASASASNNDNDNSNDTTELTAQIADNNSDNNIKISDLDKDELEQDGLDDDSLNKEGGLHKASSQDDSLEVGNDKANDKEAGNIKEDGEKEVTKEVTKKEDTQIEDTIDESAVNDTNETLVPADESSVADTPELQAARATLKDDNFDMDEEINEIFIEEAQEVMEELDTHLPAWQEDVQNLTPLSEIRRGFHTLKGSGRMVGAYNAAELAWGVENLLNRVLDNTLPPSDELLDLIVETKAVIPTLITDFAHKRPPSVDPAIIVAKANNLLKGNPINQGVAHVDALHTITSTPVSDFDQAYDEDISDSKTTLGNEPTSDKQSSLESDNILFEDDIEDVPDQSGELAQATNLVENEALTTNEETSESETPVEDSTSTIELPEVLSKILAEVTLPQDDTDADEDIKEIFIEEAGEVLADIFPIFKSWRLDTSADNLLGDIRRGFHTLKGSGRMVGAHYTAELAWVIEGMLNRILDDTIEVVPGIVSMLYDVLEKFPQMVETFEQNRTDYASISKLWVACAKAYSKGLADEFDYETVKSKWLANTHLDNEVSKIPDAKTTKTAHDSTDKALESIQTANIKLADANLPKPSGDDDEQAFFEIFLEEAEELVGTIKRFIADNKDADDIDVDDEVVRAFHTLRGAAGSEVLREVSDISAVVENSLRLLQQYEEPITHSHLEVLEQSVMLIEQFFNQCLQSNNDTLTDKSANEQSKDGIDNKQKIDAVKQLFAASISTQQLNDDKFDVAKIISDDVEDLLDAQWKLVDHFNTDEKEAKRYAGLIKSQIEILSGRVIKSATFMNLLLSLHGVYSKLESEPSIVSQDANENDAEARRYLLDTLIQGHDALTQLFDALAGNMSLKLDNSVIANLYAIAKPTPIENLLEIIKQNVAKQLADKQHKDTTKSSSNTAIADSSYDTTQTQNAVNILDIEEIKTDIELLEIFLEEAQEIDDSINDTFVQWRNNPSDLESLKVLQRHLHTIKGGARMAGISSIGDLTHEAETVYELFVNGKLSPTEQWIHVMQRVQDVLSQQIDYVVNNHESFFVNELVAQLEQFANEATIPEDVDLKIPNLKIQNEDDTDVTPQLDDIEDISQAQDSFSIDAKFQSVVVSSWGGVRPDEDILNVFLEEAREIVDSSSELLRTFQSNTSDLSVLKQLQRELHTIKGGARMVPANGIADLAHQMETVYEDLGSRRRPATKMVGQLLEACHDWMASAVGLLEYNINPPLPSQLIGALKSFSQNPDSLHSIRVDSLQFYQDLIEEREAQRASSTDYYNINEPPPASGGFDKAQEQSSLSGEMIRISSSLMERMINLSGESAINRARIDMGVSSLTHTIEEMGVTVQRLADQLRRMDIELEAQILAQIDDEELLGKADFDPLEMDQYSSLNQLSKSLAESASDLLEIKTTMIDKTRDSEGLLLQLSRTQAELQDGLMNSRMVPFSRLTPRLQRIVRQTANELGKSVELKIINADDEMDRTILERITSPLEHMLRNAVDHGIEFPKDREHLGKPATGLIVLEVLREGSEVVINLSDDGNGIDVDAVRNKAISQGLIDPNDTSLTDLDVMQYIFNAGLTTTRKVTQISGRGVGMDVVLNEIRQLGGIVSVESKRNEGSRFSMRVPLTVAVSDALVVRVADSYYAIPLVQIERVVRVNPERIYDFYQSEKPTLEIDGVDYRLRYLNEILRGSGLNELAVNTNLSLPVIIVKNQTDQQLAIQVDEVAGSRIEVVVKPLGRQLSHASGISAATIMADGSVMLILDLMALLRNAPARTQLTVSTDKDRDQALKTILIVDDSVTVRKVTSRLLERQGYATQVAKDGIDAIEILQDLKPDLMLLDIEMPRMDGFEVATQVRHDSRLKDIPIIMITSRTGDKHRQRAFEVGVNDYMGKPYQEAQLLQTVKELLGQGVHD